MSEMQRCVHLKDDEPGSIYKAPYGIEMELCLDCVAIFDKRLGNEAATLEPDLPQGIDWQRLRSRKKV